MAASFVDGLAAPIPLEQQSVVVPAVTRITGPDSSRWVSGGPVGSGRQTQLVRHIKRELGREAPKLVDGVSVTPEEVMTHQLQWVHRHCVEQLGGPPDHVSLTHPAHWGLVELDCMLEIARGIETSNVGFLPEPDAAATHFAASHLIPPDKYVVVFDFGGGTTDVSVLYKAAKRFELRGRPIGRSDLGGIDLTEKLIKYLRGFRPELEDLDTSTASGRAALDGFFQLVKQAKETLSTELAVDLALPGTGRPYRLTRSELAEVLSPLVDDAIDLIPEALDIADVEHEQVYGVLLAGGSSRMPLVSERIQSVEKLTPLSAGDPKHSVGMGAAIVAAAVAGLTSPTSPASPPERVESPALQLPAPGLGLAVDFHQQGISEGYDISFEVASRSSVRDELPPRPAIEVPPPDWDTDEEDEQPFEASSDRKLIVTASTVVVALVIIFIVARLLS